MVKVRCQLCGTVGYTASPRFQACECGGAFEVVTEGGRNLSHGEGGIFTGFVQTEQPKT